MKASIHAALVFMVLLGGAAGAAVPPLSPQQKEKLSLTTDEESEVDGGFFALLENAAAWPADEEPTGLPLDAAAIRASPAEYRGSLVLIEGTFEQQYEAPPLRPGPWGNRVEQWGIRVSRTDSVAMVYLVKPPPAPQKGARVRLAARFYRAWPVVDPRDKSTSRFLVFIGNSAQVSAPGDVPALTDDDRKMLATTIDHAALMDQPPLYRLLGNVARWPDGVTPMAPLLTHVEPVLAAPGEYRGAMLRVEGTFAGKHEEPMKWSRPGPWGERTEQWTIRLTELSDNRDDAVVVYVINPPQGIKKGDRVRVVGRFFAIWRNYIKLDKEEVPFNFVTLVASTVEPLKGRAPAAGRGGSGGGERGGYTQVLVLLLALVGAAYYFFRRFLKRMSTRSAAPSTVHERIARHRQHREEPTAEEEAAGPPLPKDPTEALAELERRSLDEKRT